MIALLAAVGWGGYASGLWPGESATTYIWLPAVESWAIAGIGYVAAVAVARVLTRGSEVSQQALLGFSVPARETHVEPGAVDDLASRAYAGSDMPAPISRGQAVAGVR